MASQFFNLLNPIEGKPFEKRRMVVNTIFGVCLGFLFTAMVGWWKGKYPETPREIWAGLWIWPTICAITSGLCYVFFARSTRNRLLWLQNQGEAGWQQSVRRGHPRTIYLLLLVGGICGLVANIHWCPNPLQMTLLGLSVFLSMMQVMGEGRIALERSLVRQRDMALQARLAPHFLHGALSTLKGQISADPLEAQGMVDQLARLSREAMALTAEREVPLSRELAFVEAYLGVERMRRGDRLRVNIEIPEALESETVPPMVLQLLVENALRHGLPVDGGEIRIEATKVSEGLQLRVEDPGQENSSSPGLGQSLGILRRRLERESDLSLEHTPEGRHQATLLLRRA